MSTLSVTDITTANGTTALSVYTGNASAGKLTFNAGGGVTLASNSTVNNFVINTTGNFLTGNLTIAIGGVQEFFVNSTLTTVNTNFTVSTNTFTLGTSSATSANGYSYLPNGLIFQWGALAGVNTVSTVTLPIAFPTSALSVTITPRSASLVGANVIYAVVVNTSTINVRSVATATNFPAYYMAIGY